MGQYWSLDEPDPSCSRLLLSGLGVQETVVGMINHDIRVRFLESGREVRLEKALLVRNLPVPLHISTLAANGTYTSSHIFHAGLLSWDRFRQAYLNIFTKCLATLNISLGFWNFHSKLSIIGLCIQILFWKVCFTTSKRLKISDLNC